MAREDSKQIATHYIGHFATSEAVRAASARAFNMDPGPEKDAATANIINRTVAPQPKVEPEDMGAIDAEIKNQFAAMPEGVRGNFPQNSGH